MRFILQALAKPIVSYTSVPYDSRLVPPLVSYITDIARENFALNTNIFPVPSTMTRPEDIMKRRFYLTDNPFIIGRSKLFELPGETFIEHGEGVKIITINVIADRGHMLIVLGGERKPEFSATELKCLDRLSDSYLSHFATTMNTNDPVTFDEHIQKIQRAVRVWLVRRREIRRVDKIAETNTRFIDSVMMLQRLYRSQTMRRSFLRIRSLAPMIQSLMRKRVAVDELRLMRAAEVTRAVKAECATLKRVAKRVNRLMVTATTKAVPLRAVVPDLSVLYAKRSMDIEHISTTLISKETQTVSVMSVSAAIEIEIIETVIVSMEILSVETVSAAPAPPEISVLAPKPMRPPRALIEQKQHENFLKLQQFQAGILQHQQWLQYHQQQYAIHCAEMESLYLKVQSVLQLTGVTGPLAVPFLPLSPPISAIPQPAPHSVIPHSVAPQSDCPIGEINTVL
jgi:hypothetical protein